MMNLRKSFVLVLVYWMHSTLCRQMPSQRKLTQISLSFDSASSVFLPCPDEMDTPFGGQLFISKSEVWDTEPTARSLSIVAPSDGECPQSLTHPVQLYLNIRFLRLNCSETFYLTAPATANTSSWLRKNFTNRSKEETDHPRRGSFGQFFQPTDYRASVYVGLEYSNSTNFCAEPQAEIPQRDIREPQLETLIEIDFTYLFTSTSPVFPEENLCSCPALSGSLRYAYVHTSLVCEEDFIACPANLHPFSDKPDPSLGKDFNCDSNSQAEDGLLCPNNHYYTTEPTSSVTTTKSITSTKCFPWFSCGQWTSRPYTGTVWPAVTIGPAPDHPMGIALTYVAIAFSLLTIMILLGFGAYIFIKERRHRREVANAPHIWTVGEVNQAMELDPNDPPPPYRPPGAPPSYGESQEGNTEVVIDMEDGYCVDADGIFFVLPDFTAELSEATPDVVADVPDSVT